MIPSFDFSIRGLISGWWISRKSSQQPEAQPPVAESSNLSFLQRIGRAFSSALSKLASCFSFFGKRGLRNRTSLLGSSAYIGRPQATASPVTVNRQSSPDLRPEDHPAVEEVIDPNGPPRQIMELPGQRAEVVLQRQEQLVANPEEEAPLLVPAGNTVQTDSVIGIPVSQTTQPVTGRLVDDQDGPDYGEDNEDFSLGNALASGVKSVVTTVTPQFVQNAAVVSGTFIWNHGLGWFARKARIVSSNPTPDVTPPARHEEQASPSVVVAAMSRPVDHTPAPVPMLVAHVDIPGTSATPPLFEREERLSTATTAPPLSRSSSNFSDRSSSLSELDSDDSSIDGEQPDSDNDQDQQPVAPPLFQIPQVEVAAAPVDHLAALPALSDYQKEGTRFTIEKLGSLNVLGVVTPNALSLRGYEKGKTAQPGTAAAHPLRFLEFIITNEQTLKHEDGTPFLTRIVNNNGWTATVGNTFRSKTFENLENALKAGTLIPNLDGFAKAIGRPEIADQLKAAAQSQDAKNKWKQFMKVLVPAYGMY